MCGIAGIINRGGGPVSLDALIRMTRSLIHRGPDEEGYFVNHGPAGRSTDENVAVRCVPGEHASPSGPAVGLGHRRLSIIDLSSGQQPLSNEDGTVWVSFNGEIYNFQALQPELESKGHRFRTHCDTEVIVHAYEEWGARCVERFRGMFAFAVWDQSKQRLFMARDRVGKKPLYYALDDDRLLFASEIKAILEAGGISRELDLTALSDYLSLLYIPSPKTIFSAIRKLPAAHFAILDRNGLEVQPYWDLSFEPAWEKTQAQIEEETLGLLEEATRLRMISEVPLGAFLSGGVDSSAVVAMMANSVDQPVITNSISFSVAEYNEAHYAERVARIYNTDHHEFHVTPDAISAVEQLAWHYDEPFADSSAIPTFYVSRTARERVTVALSGDGGDESFAGYRRYYFDLRENFVRGLVPRAIRDPVFSMIGRLYPKADYLPQVFRGKAFISNVARDPVDAYFFSMSALHGDSKRRLLRGEVLDSLKDYRTGDLFRDIYSKAPATDHLSKIQYLDIKSYLCEDILTKVDRASMAVSLEVRCPLLDHVFMEYVARIPARMKLAGRDGKHVFKKALRTVLPDDVLCRRKMGFGVPILHWLRGGIRDYAQTLILDGEGSSRYFSDQSLAKMWREHQSGVRNWSTELWAILMFNLWHSRFG